MDHTADFPGSFRFHDVRRVPGRVSGVDCKRTVELTEKHNFIYGAIGIHPSETAELEQEGAWQSLRELYRAEKCVAVGEIGLDYYWDEPEREVQKKWFARQLNLARELGLPVIIHSRDAAREGWPAAPPCLRRKPCRHNGHGCQKYPSALSYPLPAPRYPDA